MNKQAVQHFLARVFGVDLDVEIRLQEADRAAKEVLKTLTPREEGILRARFGIDDNTPETLEEIGRKQGVTRERIRQIEAKALRKLRPPTRAKKLKSFLE